MTRAIAILGATGSVGKSALDLIERSPDRFDVAAVTATTSNRSGLRSIRSSADLPTEPVAPRIAILRVTSAPIAGRRR
jgi:1-deoxy-D-xylulose 5-phosphate reductoisomerase